MKDLHRLIMRSAVYQQSSEQTTTVADKSANPLLVEGYPENRLLSRFNIQRLEAEEIGDYHSLRRRNSEQGDRRQDHSAAES